MSGTRKRRRGPSGPLVLDIRELGRRPGSMKRVSAQVPAPPDLGTAMLVVPPGGSVDLDLRLESVVEGVLVSGTVSARVNGECSRCLEPFTGRTTVAIRELFYYPGRADDAGSGEGDGEELYRVVDDHLDVEPPVRDALVLSLPLSPVCKPDCAGLCVDCGVRLDEVGPGHAHPRPDSAWAALLPLIENKEKD